MTNTQEKVQFPNEQQAQREAIMLTKGIDRYQKKADEVHAKGDLTDAELSFVQELVDAVADKISQIITEAQAEYAARGGKGRQATWVLPVSLLDPKVISFATLRECFNKAMKGGQQRQVLMGIGKAVETELWAMNLRTCKPDLYERITKAAMKNHADREYRMTAVSHVAVKEGFDVPAWDDEYCVSVAQPLLNAVMMATTVFEMLSFDDGSSNTVKFIVFTEEAKEHLKKINLDAALLRPIFEPLLVPPKPWVSYHTGCYHDRRLSRRVPLVRTYDRKHKKVLVKAIEDGLMQGPMEALNHMGAVRLAINEPVLKALKHVRDQKIEVSGMPSWSLFQMPEKVHPVRWRIMPLEERKAWKKKRHDIKVKNRSLETHWLTLNTEIALATELLYQVFYQGYSMDKRGRVYAIASFNHMKADYIRNLFEFADGKPLTEAGVPWLAIHVASTKDAKDADGTKMSKKPFEERIRWTEENTEMIERIGNDPEGTTDLWSDADKPFAFLAACVAWAGYKRDGVGYVCHLPIPLDGSNSGLQHYTAALRSEEGALVNLKHAPMPEDVYGNVASKCQSKAEQDLSDPEKHHLANLWLTYGIGRGEVKRSVMTFAYSSPMFGFAKQLMEDLMEPLGDKVLQCQTISHPDDRLEFIKKNKLVAEGPDVFHPFGNEDMQQKAATYMAKLIWDAVNEVVSSASEGMKFLQQCAALLAHEGKAVNWVTPLGLPVQNMYEEYETKRIELFLYDRKLKVQDAAEWDKVTKDGSGVLQREQMTLRTEPTGKVIKTKMKSTVSPNFIHSMDACHLQMTVLYAVKEGIKDLLLIHDSFSTHACDTSRFQGIIKQAFVDMYEKHDVFAEFYKRVWEDLSEASRKKMPELPKKGTLDIQEVLKSNYAFS